MIQGLLFSNVGEELFGGKHVVSHRMLRSGFRICQIQKNDMNRAVLFPSNHCNERIMLCSHPLVIKI